MSVSGFSRLRPGGVSLIQTFSAAPVEKSSGIEKYNQQRAGRDNDAKIHIIPLLFRGSGMRQRLRRNPRVKAIARRQRANHETDAEHKTNPSTDR